MKMDYFFYGIGVSSLFLATLFSIVDKNGASLSSVQAYIIGFGTIIYAKLVAIGGSE